MFFISWVKEISINSEIQKNKIKTIIYSQSTSFHTSVPVLLHVLTKFVSTPFWTFTQTCFTSSVAFLCPLFILPINEALGPVLHLVIWNFSLVLIFLCPRSFHCWRMNHRLKCLFLLFRHHWSNSLQHCFSIREFDSTGIHTESLCPFFNIFHNKEKLKLFCRLWKMKIPK